MNNDFQNFINNPCVETAKKVMKHAGKISAQCVWGNELDQAQKLLNNEKEQ